MKTRPVLLSGLLLVLSIPSADARKIMQKVEGDNSPPDIALRKYIAAVEAEGAEEAHTPGSLWEPNGALTQLSSDVRAMHVHDPISVVVSESLAASTDGTVKDSRSSSANSQVSSILGPLHGGNALANLLGQSSSSGLNAQGESVTSSSLSTIFGGQVEAILPNGMMVIQAVRQLTFSQQTQLVTLRGLVWPEDINSNNQILSTDITDLEIQVTGRGIINDATHRQNAFVRLLQRIFVF